MEGGDLELGELLAAAEAAPPGESVGVVAHDLQKRFGAETVSFLFVDLIGQRLVRLAAAGDEPADPGEPIDLQGSVYDSVLQSQRQRVEPDGQGGRRVITPVTNRGDCIGVLEVTLQSADDTVLRQVRDAAHALAYIIVTDGRFTDLYHLGRRTTETSLAAEIQHQLLPSAPCCEAAQPFGVVASAPYRLQELLLRPGDRPVLLTDGMQERGAAAVDLASVVHDTRALHPREAVRSLTAAVLDACHGSLKDDATLLILDWHSNRSRPAETRPDPQR